MIDPTWTLHSTQRHQVIHRREGVYHAFFRESTTEDSVVFQRTLAGAITMDWVEDGQARQDLVLPGQAMLFGPPEPGSRSVAPGIRYECHWLRLIGTGLRAHWLWLRAQFGGVVTIDPDGEAVHQANELTDGFARGEHIPSRSVHRFVCLLAEELTTVQHRRLSPTAVAIERMRSNPFRPWSLKQLAVQAGCSREHLTRAFTDQIGVPPATWLREQRYDRAVRLIETTDIPFSEVAQASGFGSLDTLGRLVRQRHGVSASELRTAWRLMHHGQAPDD